MNSSLFRQQAINAQQNHLYGEVILKLPLSFRLITFFILSAVLVAALFVAYGAYSRKESVIGYLVPNKGLVKVYAPQKGVLEGLYIKEGQFVKKDDVIFTVSNDFANGLELDATEILLDKINHQKENLKLKIQHEKLLSDERIKAIDIQVSGLKRELSQLDIAIALQEKQLKLTLSKKNTAKNLFDKGYLSTSQLQDIERSHLDNKVLFQTTIHQQTQLENRNNDLLQQQVQIPIQWRSRLTDLESEISELEQRIIELTDRRTFRIRAPVNGRVSAIQVSEGQTLSTQSLLIAILPDDSELQAELFLPTRAAGFTAIGQQVLLRYDAFPYQHYGLYKGQINEIAQVILTPNELPVPVALNEPVYRIRVNIDKQSIDAFGKKLPLQAGMLLKADIILEERSLGQWLLEPIYGLGS